jgi:hypothetical protein
MTFCYVYTSILDTLIPSLSSYAPRFNYDYRRSYKLILYINGFTKAEVSFGALLREIQAA